ncbi:MAG: hypothetical protein Q9217_007051, partial [Psora testacea]
PVPAMEEQRPNLSYSKPEGDNAALAPPINSTKTRRALTIATTWIAVHTKHSVSFTVKRISPGLIVKRGAGVRLEEAGNLEYVRNNTSVPVPKVHCAFTRKGCTYIVMDYIPGQTLLAWWHTASAESKESIRRQLAGHMSKLRNVPNPTSGRISGLKGGAIYDYRYCIKGDGPYLEESFGPFQDPHEFHLWLRNGFTSPVSSGVGEKSNQDADIDRMCQIQDRRNYATKLTHGDFHTQNIIVKDNKIAGIIDWEMAAWYPEYWEYTSAWHVNVFDEFWRAEVEKILDGHDYKAELEADKIRRRYFQYP